MLTFLTSKRLLSTPDNALKKYAFHKWSMRFATSFEVLKNGGERVLSAVPNYALSHDMTLNKKEGKRLRRRMLKVIIWRLSRKQIRAQWPSGLIRKIY